MRGSTPSTTESRRTRSYLGGPSAASAAFTVFFEHPTTRAITLIGIPSDLRSRRISAQSSTDNTPFLPSSDEPGSPEGVRFRLPPRGQFSRAVDRREAFGGLRGRAPYTSALSALEIGASTITILPCTK